MKKTLNGIIGLFTSNMQYRQLTMGKPVKDGNHIIATEGHVIIIAPCEHFAPCDFSEMTDKFPAYKRIIPEHDKEKVLFTTDPKFISDEANVLLRKDEYTECERCDGDGSLYTHSHAERTCDECGGEGTDEYLGNLIPIPNEEFDNKDDKTFVFKIGDIYYNPNFMQNISRVANALNETMKWVCQEPDKGSVIYIGDVLIIVMPIKGVPNQKNYLGDLTIIEIPVTK